MAATVRIEHVSAGWREILQGSGVSSLVYATGDELAALAGDGFVSRHGYGGFGGGRAVCHVGTSDYASMVAEANDKALTKALHQMG